MRALIKQGYLLRRNHVTPVASQNSSVPPVVSVILSHLIALDPGPPCPTPACAVRDGSRFEPTAHYLRTT